MMGARREIDHVVRDERVQQLARSACSSCVKQLWLARWLWIVGVYSSGGREKERRRKKKSRVRGGGGQKNCWVAWSCGLRHQMKPQVTPATGSDATRHKSSTRAEDIYINVFMCRSLGYV